MNKYYEVIGILNGNTDILYGSFLKTDCTYEVQAEKESWKSEGYKNIKIVSRETQEIPDQDVYKGELITSHQLFLQQAPSFNFELDQDALLEQALESGYCTKVSGKEDLYLINTDYFNK